MNMVAPDDYVGSKNVAPWVDAELQFYGQVSRL